MPILQHWRGGNYLFSTFPVNSPKKELMKKGTVAKATGHKKNETSLSGRGLCQNQMFIFK